MLVPLIAAGIIGSTAAQAQTNAINPYTYTCGDLLAAAGAAAGSTENTLGNLMVLWSIGYMYGRLEPLADSPLNAGNFDQARSDMVGALTGICPNVPEMPIAEFASNLAGDFERSAAAD